MNRIIFFLFFSLIALVGNVQAQWFDIEKAPSKIQKKFKQAIEEIGNENYEKALDLIDQCLEKYPKFTDGHLMKGGIFFIQKKYKETVQEYETAFHLDSLSSRDYLFSYSIALAGTGRFSEALSAVDAYIKTVGLKNGSGNQIISRKKSYVFALEQEKKIAKSDYRFSPFNLGDSINSAESEYFPLLTLDQNKIIFTRKIGNSNEDFFYSIKKEGVWTKAKPLEGHLNTEDNEGGPTISQDGQVLYFTGCNMEDGFGGCDLYVSYRNGEEWSERINLGDSVNTPYWESQPSLSPDQKFLYFSSRIPGGFGETDLYYCEKQPDGKWGIPVNMGPEFNTAGNETSPFVHSDNQTFYFASDGHLGYGGTDLFLCRRMPDGKWGKPENLGYPINTIDDQGSLFVSADGKTAFFTSNGSDSRGRMDLYSFELPVYAQPIKTLWITGKIFDRKTQQGIAAVVELKDVEDKALISSFESNIDGSYLIPLPVGKNFAFHVNRKGYLFYSESFSLKEKSNDTGYVVNIPLTPIETNASIELKNIFFHYGKAELQTTSYPELNKLVQLLTENPSIKAEIIGHTDNKGKASENLTLSNQRAAAVVAYLVKQGVKASRLVAKGMGASQPIDSNDTESGRARNRRTELKVLSFE